MSNFLSKIRDSISEWFGTSWEWPDLEQPVEKVERPKEWPKPGPLADEKDIEEMEKIFGDKNI